MTCDLICGLTFRAVAILAHEFGHVENAQKQGAIWVKTTELLKQHAEGMKKFGHEAWVKSAQYQQIVSQLGTTPVAAGAAREVAADGAAIPVLRDYYAKGAGHGSMPKRVREAIQKYEKAHPK